MMKRFGNGTCPIMVLLCNDLDVYDCKTSIVVRNAMDSEISTFQ